MPTDINFDCSGYDTVFCDSMAALDVAYANGLARSAVVLTRSPALIVKDDINTVVLDDRKQISDETIESTYLATTEFLLSCFRQLTKCADTAPFATLVCRIMWQSHARALCAALLVKDDFIEPRLILEPVVAGRQTPEWMRFPWATFLEANARARRFRVEIPLGDESRYDRENSTLWERFQINGPEHFLWRIAERLWKRAPQNWGSRRFFYLKENEIICDIGAQFALRGFRIDQLAIPELENVEGKAHPLGMRIGEIVRQPLERRLSGIMPKLALGPVMDEFERNLARQLFAYDQTLSVLEERAQSIFGKRENIVISNYPWGGSMLAVSHFAARNGIVFAGATHGISREILHRPQSLCNYENTFTQLAFVQSARAKQRLDVNPFRFAGSQTVNVGEPSDVKRLARMAGSRWRTKGHPSVLYVQMQRTAAFFNAGIYQNDYANCRLEADLIRNAFSQVPHEIAFKTYPGRRYHDPDPNLDLVRETPNLHLLATGKDLRYIISNFRLIICTYASSTLGWCIGSGKPVVYIDPRVFGQRLSEDIADQFKKYFIYFDAADADFIQSMRLFLSRPMGEIEEEWQVNEEGRAEALREFFGKTGESAGRIGYRSLKGAWSRRQRALAAGSATEGFPMRDWGASP